MAKRTVSVAYEDPRFSKKEAAYWKQVRDALDAMGAPNSGELLHNSKTYVEGVHRAGLPAIDAAAVIWHKHCQSAGTAAVPCVAEDSLSPHEPWVLLEPGVWEWRTMPYPPGGYAVIQLTRKRGFQLGRWDSRIGRPSFAALAIYPSLESAQNAAAMYAALPGGREQANIESKRVFYEIVATTVTGQRVVIPGGTTLEGAEREAKGMIGQFVYIGDKPHTVKSTTVMPVTAKFAGAAECPCDTESVTESGHPLLPRMIIHILKYPDDQFQVVARMQHTYNGPWQTVFVGFEEGAGRARAEAIEMKDRLGKSRGAKSVEIVHGGLEETPTVSEANDSAPSCVPFTRLERNNEAFQACQRIANGPLEDDAAMYRLLSAQLGKEDQEVFVVVGLDLHRNLRSYTEVARGQRDRVAVNVEDVLRAAILDGPHGFVVAHNHPSGKANPSPADRDLTKRIRAGAAVGCPSIVFLDHIVVGQGEYFSFADNKLKKVR